MVRPICWMMTGAKPFGRLVEQQQARAGAQDAPDCQHLLLAAGELGALAAQPLLDVRKQRENAPRSRARRASPRAADRGSPRRRGSRRCRAPPGRTRCPCARDRIRRKSNELAPLEAHRAGALADDPHDRFERRGLAGAVAAEQRHDLAGAHVERRRRAGCATRRTRPAGPSTASSGSRVIRHGRPPYRLRALPDCSTRSRSRPRPARGRASAP